jgi:hypothetical protein
LELPAPEPICHAAFGIHQPLDSRSSISIRVPSGRERQDRQRRCPTTSSIITAKRPPTVIRVPSCEQRI